MSRWEIGLANPNLLGAIASTVVAASTAYASFIPIPARAWSRALWCLAAGGAMVILAGTLSRAGLVSAVLGLAALGCWPSPVARRWLAWSMLAVVVVAVLSWPGAWDRAVKGSHGDGDPSIATRFHLWRTALAVIADQPWSGCGSDFFSTAELVLEDPPAHLMKGRPVPLSNALNDALDVGAKYGLPVMVGALAAILGSAMCFASLTDARLLPLGRAVIIALLTWTSAGMFTRTWSYNGTTLAVASLAVALPLIGLIWSRALPARQLFRSFASAVLISMVLGLGLWISAYSGLRSLTSPPLRLLRDGEHRDLGWGLGPRVAAPSGTALWLPDADETPNETIVFALRTLARADLNSWASIGSLSPSVIHPPFVVLAREEACRRIPALVHKADALVLMDCPPYAVADIALAGGASLLLYGLPDPREWAAESEPIVRLIPRCTFATAPLGRLWPNRFPRVMPMLVKWLAANGAIPLHNP